MNIEDGSRVYEHNHLLTGDHELYAFEGGLFVLYSRDKNAHVAIDPIGMTADEIVRAVSACDTVLARQPVPMNRHERRKAAKLN